MSGRMNMGRPAVTYIDNLKSDTSLESAEELRTASGSSSSFWCYVISFILLL